MTGRLSIAEAKRFGGFLAVSGINTVFGYAAFAACLLIGLTPSMALIFGNIAGIAFNFRSFGVLFGSHGYRRIPAFVAVYAVILFGNLIGLHILIGSGFQALIAQGIAVCILAPLSFLMMRHLVFGNPK